jgi:hypothetical protein
LGSDGISINGENKKKNTTSLTVVCDQNKHFRLMLDAII